MNIRQGIKHEGCRIIFNYELKEVLKMMHAEHKIRMQKNIEGAIPRNKSERKISSTLLVKCKKQGIRSRSRK